MRAIVEAERGHPFGLVNRANFLEQAGRLREALRRLGARR